MQEVDHYALATNQRRIYTKQQQGADGAVSWAVQDVNP
jgi:hypothetical protein